MNDISTKLLEFLKEGEFITDIQLQEATLFAEKTQKSIEEALVEKDFIKDRELGQIIANIHAINFVDLAKESIDMTILKLIPEAVARKQKVIAFGKDDKGLQIAMNDPDNSVLIHLLHKTLNQSFTIYYATAKDINEAAVQYQKEITGTFKALLQSSSHEAIFEEASESAIVKIVDLLINQGYRLKASDVHIEPNFDNTIVRFRIDGVMQQIVEIPQDLHKLVITRIKILAKLRTDEHQKPQDGKIQHVYEGEEADIRVSIVPTNKGENVVMRLLSESSRQYSLDELGLREEDLIKLEANIKKPWGMILSTGPTGSGKTTLLYSILKILNQPNVNIATIEDPVEYNIKGITQIQIHVKADLTFASGLRSIVRQDPDIIMVGEIRDRETAEIAVNSAMTGHLVLSTLHTNDAATTMPRLLDMEIEKFLLVSTVNVIIGQRLLRRICPKCIRSEIKLKTEMEQKIPSSLIQAVFGDKNEATLYEGIGCEDCHGSGYQGRIGVFEIMEINDEIKILIMNNANANEIKQKAIELGMSTMLDDAIEKAKNGMTSIEEVLRVVKY